MLQIWGRPNSINVQKVLWTLAELGLEAEHHVVGGPHGGLDTDRYGALNPNRRIPALVDGDTVVWESNAIVRYLAAKYGDGTLWASDPAARSQADRWMDWQASGVTMDLIPVFLGLIRTPAAERDMAAIGAAGDRLNGHMTVLAGQLQQTAYVAGDTFTMGDIPVGALAYRWLNLPMDRPDLPAVQAYHDRLAQRPAFREHVMQPLT